MLLPQKDLEVMNISKLPEAKQKEILKLKNEIVLNHEGILSYSKDASQKITDFSTELLNSVKLKDAPEVEGIIMELVGELDSIDTKNLMDNKPSLFKKLFKTNDLKNFLAKYESVDSVVSDVSKKLEQAEYQLKKDVDICDLHLEKNLEYIESLDEHIIAGKLRLKDEQDKLMKEKMDLDSEDVLAVQEFSLKEAEIDRLDRRIHDLLVMRSVAIQNIPQIRLIKDGNSVLIEKIESSISSVIPLWKSQMAISIQILRQQNGVKLQKSITDTSNKLIEKNAELLRQSATSVATELERDLVDFETLKKSNENLIATLKEIREIREQGKKQREQVVVELAQLQGELNKALIEQQR